MEGRGQVLTQRCRIESARPCADIRDQFLSSRTHAHMHRAHRFANPFVCRDDRFDFPQLDPLSSYFDLMITAPEKLEHPVGVQTREVARTVEPLLLTERCCRHKTRLRPLPLDSSTPERAAGLRGRPHRAPAREQVRAAVRGETLPSARLVLRSAANVSEPLNPAREPDREPEMPSPRPSPRSDRIR